MTKGLSRLKGRAPIVLIGLCPACFVYDEQLLKAEADAGSGGQVAAPPEELGGSGGQSTDGTTPAGGTGGTAETGGTAGEICSWERLPAVLSREPFDVVDNFNDGDNQIPEVEGRDGAWFSINDGTGGFQKPAIGGWGGVVMQMVDENESNRALHYQAWGFTGTGTGDGWHAFGVQLAAGAVYPLGAYDGLAFWARADCETPGSEQAFLRVAISDSESEQSGGTIDHAGNSIGVVLTEEWRQIKLPFDNFTRRFGGGVVFDPNDAIGLYFGPETEGSLDIWIDDLLFYSDE